MNLVPPLAILLFGVALGACLPALVQAGRRWYRRTWARPTLLQLDPRPLRGARPDAAPKPAPEVYSLHEQRRD